MITNVTATFPTKIEFLTIIVSCVVTDIKRFRLVITFSMSRDLFSGFPVSDDPLTLVRVKPKFQLVSRRCDWIAIDQSRYQVPD